MACLQDLSQARARWGAAADGFLTLFTHKLLLPGIADVATLKAISALAGEVDVQVSSVTQGGLPRQASTTWSLRRQPRLPVDAVAAGTPGAALFMSGTKLARVWLPTLRPWWRTSHLPNTPPTKSPTNVPQLARS